MEPIGMYDDDVVVTSLCLELGGVMLSRSLYS